jgi:hypothetical protein
MFDHAYTDYDLENGEYCYYLEIRYDASSYSEPLEECTFLAYQALPGDANSDNIVNVNDIQVVVSYMLEQNPYPFVFYAADVNEDGEVNVLDIFAIINIIYNK